MWFMGFGTRWMDYGIRQGLGQVLLAAGKEQINRIRAPSHFTKLQVFFMSCTTCTLISASSYYTCWVTNKIVNCVEKGFERVMALIVNQFVPYIM